MASQSAGRRITSAEPGCRPRFWYFRVVEPGEIGPGQTSRLVARPHPECSLDRVWRLLYRDRLDRAALAAFAALPELPERWRTLAERRLASGRTEDWTRRLETPQ